MEQLKRLLAQSRVGPTYQKVESHSRNASLDFSIEEQRLQGTIRTLRRWLSFLGVLLVVCLLALGTNIALQRKLVKSSGSSGPQFPSKVVVFESDERYSSSATPESDRAWFSLLPPGKGFVLVNEPDQTNLKPGMPVDSETSGQLYNIAAFHQLHCLTSIREYLWHLKFAVGTNSTEQIRPILLDPEEDHILDCFDYLRQSVMCSADTTLEWPQQESASKSPSIDGWGVPHQCVDWDAVLEYTEKNAYHPTDR